MNKKNIAFFFSLARIELCCTVIYEGCKIVVGGTGQCLIKKNKPPKKIENVAKY